MKQRLLALATLITVSVAISSCNGEAVELKLALAKGDTYKSSVKMDQKVTTSAMGMNMNIDQVIEINQTLQVDEVKADGNIVFSNVMDRFYMKQSMPMMGMPIDVEYDTDKPEKKAGAMGESMAQYFEKMKGLTYHLEMDAHGKLVKSDMDEVYKKLGLDTMSQKGGNNSEMGRNTDQYLNNLPDKPVKKGDTYVIENKASELLPVGTKNTYTVKEITADKVILEVNSEFLPGKAANGVEMSVKGDQKGTIEIDRKTGMTLKSEIKQNMDMEITSMGMKMPMKINGTTTFTCEKK